MIINTPTKLDFENLAKENLTQSIKLLFKVHENYSELDELSKDISIDEIWEYNQGTLRTTLILLHQAIESLMKSTICETSPLLLIDKPRKDWPTLPESENKEFDSLYTIGGESLLKTFCAVPSSIDLNIELINFIETIREKRNNAIHGFNVKEISPRYILTNILKVFNYWFGKESWKHELNTLLLNDPLFGTIDSEFEKTNFYKYLDFITYYITKKELAQYISFNIQGREYYCPFCKYKIDEEFGFLESKWAFLFPNKPTSTKLKCLNCNDIVDVLRLDCKHDDCKGNVLYNDIDITDETYCLTCYEIQ